MKGSPIPPPKQPSVSAYWASVIGLQVVMNAGALSRVSKYSAWFSVCVTPSMLTSVPSEPAMIRNTSLFLVLSGEVIKFLPQAFSGYICSNILSPVPEQITLFQVLPAKTTIFFAPVLFTFFERTLLPVRSMED